MDVQLVTVAAQETLDAAEAAAILRATGVITLPNHKPGDTFCYDIGSRFHVEEGGITYRPLLEGGMQMVFTPFLPKERILSLEERVKRVELFCASLREGFPQLSNVVSILRDAASALGPIER